MSPTSRLIALLCVFALPPAVFAQDEPPVRLAGAIHYAGGEWPVLVDLRSIDEGSASMSFMALGMSGMDAPASVDADGVVTIEIPFGIGEQRLTWSEGAYRTETGPDDRDAVAVVLAPDSAAQMRSSPVAFRNVDVDLHGELFLPAEPVDGGYPLIVVGHGGDRFSRQKPEYRFWAEHVTRRGYAVFLYDKRGVGESGGSHDEASLDTLVEDYVAAARAAPAQQGVDPDRIALLGGSQFGWIAFRAARELDVDAVVLKAAPAVDPVTLEVRVLEDQLRGAEIEGEDLADAMAYVRLYFAAARHPELFESVTGLADRFAESVWIEHVPVPSAPSDMTWWGTNAGFDPSSDISAFSGPVFLAYGWEDTAATPQINALRYEYLLGKGDGELTLWLADDADHRIEVPPAMVDGVFRFPQLAPGLLDRIDEFLSDHLQQNQ